MILNLENELLQHLPQAREFCVAVALMKPFGFDLFEGRLDPVVCNRKYLVGIHLPTDPKVLQNMLDLHNETPDMLEAKIYDLGQVYHPKVYIIRKLDGEIITFIGSANATKGGLRNNIEMCFSITDQKQCIQIMQWFNDIFNSCKHYDQSFIDKYVETYRQNLTVTQTQKSNIEALVNPDKTVPSNNIVIPPGQYFTMDDFNAFAPATHEDTLGPAVEKRSVVRQKLLKMDKNIKPYFHKYGMFDLHNHPNRQNYTSQHFFSGRKNNIDAIWLHYGISETELLKFNYSKKFINHLRIQIILRNAEDRAYIGFWLYIGQGVAGYWDREYIKSKLTDFNFMYQLFDHLKSLGASYYISIKGIKTLILDISSIEDLVEILSDDFYSEYFVIGRDYPPDHEDLSVENIYQTTLIVFSKLYKVYDLIRDRAN